MDVAGARVSSGLYRKASSGAAEDACGKHLELYTWFILLDSGALGSYGHPPRLPDPHTMLQGGGAPPSDKGVVVWGYLELRDSPLAFRADT